MGQILKLPSRWAIDEFLKKHHADLYDNEEDLTSDRQPLRQLKTKNAII